MSPSSLSVYAYDKDHKNILFFFNLLKIPRMEIKVYKLKLPPSYKNFAIYIIYLHIIITEINHVQPFFDTIYSLYLFVYYFFFILILLVFALNYFLFSLLDISWSTKECTQHYLSATYWDLVGDSVRNCSGYIFVSFARFRSIYTFNVISYQRCSFSRTPYKSTFNSYIYLQSLLCCWEFCHMTIFFMIFKLVKKFNLMVEIT